MPVWVKILAFRSQHPKWDQNLQFTTLSETTSIPVTLIWESHPPGRKHKVKFYEHEITDVQMIYTKIAKSKLRINQNLLYVCS